MRVCITYGIGIFSHWGLRGIGIKKRGGRLVTSFFGCVGKKWVGCLTGQLKPAPEDEISHPVFGHGGALGQTRHLMSGSLPGYEAYPVLPFCAV